MQKWEKLYGRLQNQNEVNVRGQNYKLEGLTGQLSLKLITNKLFLNYFLF